MQKIKKRLGEMFVEKGLVTEDQVQDVLQEQTKTQNKNFIGEMFVEKGFVVEDDLLMTLAEQFGIEFVELAKKDIDWEVPARFSSSFIDQHRCLPFQADEETVTLAITNPLNAWAISVAEKQAAPSDVNFVLAKKTELDAAIKEYQMYSMRQTVNRLKKATDNGGRSY